MRCPDHGSPTSYLGTVPPTCNVTTVLKYHCKEHGALDVLKNPKLIARDRKAEARQQAHLREEITIHVGCGKRVKMTEYQVCRKVLIQETPKEEGWFKNRPSASL